MIRKFRFFIYIVPESGKWQKALLLLFVLCHTCEWHGWVGHTQYGSFVSYFDNRWYEILCCMQCTRLFEYTYNFVRGPFGLIFLSTVKVTHKTKEGQQEGISRATLVIVCKESIVGLLVKSQRQSRPLSGGENCYWERVLSSLAIDTSQWKCPLLLSSPCTSI